MQRAGAEERYFFGDQYFAAILAFEDYSLFLALEPGGEVAERAVRGYELGRRCDRAQELLLARFRVAGHQRLWLGPEILDDDLLDVGQVRQLRYHRDRLRPLEDRLPDPDQKPGPVIVPRATLWPA